MRCIFARHLKLARFKRKLDNVNWNEKINVRKYEAMRMQNVVYKIFVTSEWFYLNFLNIDDFFFHNGAFDIIESSLFLHLFINNICVIFWGSWSSFNPCLSGIVMFVVSLGVNILEFERSSPIPEFLLVSYYNIDYSSFRKFSHDTNEFDSSWINM